MQNHEELIQLALTAGAGKAAVIRTEDIAVPSVFRDICAGNACGKYGRCWMCPPDIGEIDVLMARLREYRNGLLYQTIYDIEDSFDIEGMSEASRKHAQVSQRVNDAVKPLLPGCLHLSCGGCNLCERCAKLDGEPCRLPDKALPPMEGYGIDVYNTTKPTDLKYINGQNTVTFFGIVLF
ncbi:MAG: DUF2284 domain-containing protein [Clostridia bacterium]|nr:DUF2284 domain-containing protein [Clostridia bacterium]